MEIIRNFFYSKVLLTGEYTVTLGSKALAIPFRRFKGSFHWSGIENESLKTIYDYIVETPLNDIYDIQKFDKILRNLTLLQNDKKLYMFRNGPSLNFQQINIYNFINFFLLLINFINNN